MLHLSIADAFANAFHAAGGVVLARESLGEQDVETPLRQFGRQRGVRIDQTQRVLTGVVAGDGAYEWTVQRVSGDALMRLGSGDFPPDG